MNEAQIIKQHYQRIGKAGGMAGVGRSKARTKAQARKAAKARWAGQSGILGSRKNGGEK